mmetsp:Transcript_38926/g.49161  ORF Transcript_38926/g.49161 Transcript_38926/m.49161 type:complete len:650 (-) Transcript_38926:315-2264(-)
MYPPIWRIAFVSIAIFALTSSQSYGGPASYSQQGPPPPGQYAPPGQQQYPPPGQSTPAPPTERSPREQQQPEGIGGYPGAPPQQQFQQPPQQYQGGPPSQGYGGPPGGDYNQQARRPGGPGGMYTGPPRNLPPSQQPQQEEGPGLFAKLKGVFSREDQPEGPQRPAGPGPYSPYGQRMLPPTPGAGAGSSFPQQQQPGGQYQQQQSNPNPYAGPGRPLRPSPPQQQGQQNQEEGAGFFSKLKSKLFVEDPTPQPSGPPQGQMGMPRYMGAQPSGGLQQPEARYGGYPQERPQQPGQQMGMRPAGQIPPPPQQQGGAPPAYGTQLGVPPPPPLDTMPPLDEEQLNEEEVPVLQQTDDGTQILICKPLKLERKKIRIAREGAFNLQVISRFEKTLTKFRWATNDGQHSLPTLSTTHLVEEMLLPEAALKLKELDTEFSKRMEEPEADKQALAEEHLNKMMDILRVGQLNYFSIPQYVTNFVNSIPLREDTGQLLKTLCWKNVPVTIFSPGFGDVIHQAIAQQTQLPGPGGALPPNIKILSNFLKPSYDGRCLGTYPPVYFEGNCNLTAAAASSPDQVAPRPNLLVLGSSPDGFDVAPGFNTHDTISVGFMEVGKDFISDLSKFAANYDIVVIGDGSFKFVSEMVEDILGTN